MTAHGSVLVRLLRAHKPTVGAEIGVHRGGTSAQLLRAFPALHLHMVDPWSPPPQESAWWRSGDPCSRYTAGTYDQHREAAINSTRFAASRRSVWQSTGVEAARSLPPLDFAFIDGDHSESGCFADIEAFWPLIRPGGVLFGHDYWPSYNARNRHTKGVRRAVDRFFADRSKLKVHAAGSGVWWAEKPSGPPCLSIGPVLESTLRSILRPGLRTLEFGSGLSTRVFASAGCEHTAIEQDAEHARTVSAECPGVRVVHAPLADGGWYDWSPGSALPFDVILVDGPRGPEHRAGILPHVERLSHPETVVIVDDAHRPEDSELARSIAVAIGGSVERVDDGAKQFAKVRRHHDIVASTKPPVLWDNTASF